MISDRLSTRGPVVAVADDEDHEQQGEREEYVDKAHQGGVDDAAQQAGHRPHQGADDGGDQGGEKADLQGRLAAFHYAAQFVEAVGVGAQRVAPARRKERIYDVGRGLVGVVKNRAHEAKQDKKGDYGRAHHGQAVFDERGDGQAPARPRPLDLAPLGAGC